jgi:uncharacterized membrane protein YhaH (DUF805 family)
MKGFLRAVFGWRGRLPRGAYFARLAVILAAFAILDAALEPLLGGARVWVLNPLALWALLAASARRLHDRDYAAGWIAAGLVPVFGLLWLLWQFCRRGAASDNRHGPDPLRETGDFLVVGG